GNGGVVRSQVTSLRFHSGGSAGASDRLGGGALDIFLFQRITGGKTPGAIGDDAHANAQRFSVGNVAGLAILGGESTLTLIHNASVGIGCASLAGGIEGELGDNFHRELLISTVPHTPGAFLN